jgi:glycine oxidase
VIRATDVAIVGGGVIGLAIAWRCVQHGLRVVVHDGGAETAAWYAAAGMLAPAGEATFGQEALGALMVESARRWPGFAAELSRATGLDLGYDTTGALSVALTDDDLAQVRRLGAYQRSLGLPVAPLTASELRDREPGLSPRLRGGTHAPGDHQVDPRRVVAALRAAVHAGGGVVSAGPVSPTGAGPGGSPLGRGGLGEVGGVGELGAAMVVVAAGVGTAALTGLPVRPVKGQVLRLRGEPGVIRHMVSGYADGRHVYLVPRADGEVVVGATQEERADRVVTAGAVLELLRAAVDLVPELAEFELVEAVARHRPATPDNAPLLGRLAGGVVVAAGHHRNGVLLTPITADLIADLVATGTADPMLAPFSPDRFGDGEERGRFGRGDNGERDGVDAG